MNTPTPPNAPPKPEPEAGVTRMRVLSGAADVRDGRLYIVYTMEIFGSEEEQFTVTITGDPSSKLIQFVNAARAVECLLSEAMGGSAIPGVSFEPANTAPGSRRLQ